MKHWDNAADHNDLSARFDTSARPVVTMDVEKYQRFLDETDMTDAEKEEFLQALWSIVVNFVELGFGVHPLQEVCGRIKENCPEFGVSDSDTVDSKENEEEEEHDDKQR